jgi:ribosomal protein S18 acetylase RimI-like enzyme
MDGASSEPVPLCVSQISQAAELLARAFHLDPMIGHLFLDATTRPRRAARCFSVVLRYGLSQGETYRTPSGLEGVAVWLPPGPVHPSSGTVFRLGLQVLLKLGPAALLHMLRYSDYVGDLRERLLPAGHWYLQLLGVSPDCQGRGVGKSLLAPMLARLDRLRLPCGLDTMNSRNVEIYQRFGFRVVHQGLFPKSNVPMWLMLREPQPEREYA